MTVVPYHSSTIATSSTAALAPADDSAARAALTAEALPLLAILRKGAPKEGNKPGRELNHFRMDWRPGYERLAAAFEDLYGPEPERIPGLRLIGEHPFQFYYEAWHGNATLKARHDGRFFVKRWAGESGYDFTPVPVEAYPDLAAECTPVGRLFFWLPALAASTFEIGKFIAITTSINDCAGLYSYVEMLSLSHLPIYELDFELFREGRNFTVPVKGKPSVVTKHMVRLRVLPGSYGPALADPTPFHLDTLTGEIIDAPLDAAADDGEDPDDYGQPDPRPVRGLTKDETRQLYDEAKTSGMDRDTLLGVLGVPSIDKWQSPEPLLDGIALIHRWVEANTPPEQGALFDPPAVLPGYYAE